MSTIIKWVLIALLLSPIFFFAFRQKKWYLYLLFAFVGLLPEQFGLNLHDKLPMITVPRVLIVILAVFWLIKKCKERKFVFPISLVTFLAINLIISAVNLRHGFDEVNRMFLFVVERGFLIIAAADFIESKEELNRCVDFMILGCVVLSVMGILQTVWEYDITSVLHLTKTVTSAKISNRMNLVRAFGTSNAIAFGCYCVFMLLLIYFRLANTKKQHYSAAFAVTFVAMICTLTRSAWLCALAILFLLVVFHKGKPFLQLLPSAAIAVVLCLLLCVAQPKLYKAFVETGKSTANTIVSVLPDSWFPKSNDDTTKKKDTSSADKDSDKTATTKKENTSSADKNSDKTTTTKKENTSSADKSSDKTATTKKENTSSADKSSDKTTTTKKKKEKKTTTKKETAGKAAFDLDENFGLNANAPIGSRNDQWSAVRYMAQEDQLLFGYGYNAYLEGKIHYMLTYKGRDDWTVAHAVDVGLVYVATESGLIGLFALIGFLGFMLVVAWIRKTKTAEFDLYKLMLYIIPLYVTVNILASLPNNPVVWLSFALFYAYHKLDGYACDKCIRFPKPSKDEESVAD